MRFRSLTLLAVTVISAIACSSSSNSNPTRHSCSFQDNLTICHCSAFQVGDADQPSQSGTCNATTYAGALCCASPGWPQDTSKATSCSCVAGSLENASCPNGDAADQTIQVDTCDFFVDPVGGGSSGSDAGGGTKKCTDTGSCGPDGDNCACGTQCIHYGPGEYMCGFDCATTADCAGKKDPPSGDALTACNPGLQTDTADYDGYCIRP